MMPSSGFVRCVSTDNEPGRVDLVRFSGAFAAMVAVDQRMSARADAERFRHEFEIGRSRKSFFEIFPKLYLADDDAIRGEPERCDVRRGKLDVVAIEREDRVEIARI